MRVRCLDSPIAGRHHSCARIDCPWFYSGNGRAGESRFWGNSACGRCGIRPPDARSFPPARDIDQLVTSGITEVEPQLAQELTTLSLESVGRRRRRGRRRPGRPVTGRVGGGQSAAPRRTWESTWVRAGTRDFIRTAPGGGLRLRPETEATAVGYVDFRRQLNDDLLVVLLGEQVLFTRHCHHLPQAGSGPEVTTALQPLFSLAARPRSTRCRRRRCPRAGPAAAHRRGNAIPRRQPGRAHRWRFRLPPPDRPARPYARVRRQPPVRPHRTAALRPGRSG